MYSNSPNLRFLFRVPASDLYKQRKAQKPRNVQERQFSQREKIVYHAMKRFVPATTLKDVLYNRRRSENNDERLISDFQEFEQPEHHIPRDYHYQRALRVTEQLFRPKKPLHPIHYSDLRYYPWHLSTSAEAPFTTETKWNDVLREKQRDGDIEDGRASFHNLYNEIFVQNRFNIHAIKHGYPAFWNEDGTPKPYYYTTLHARAHVVERNEPDKIRAVFGVPKLLLQAENMFIWPLQSYYLNDQNQDSPLLWGNEIMKGGWKRLWSKVYNGERRVNTVLSLDWSAFDKRALHELIDDIHIMWRSWFDFSAYQGTSFYPNPPANPSKSENLWRWMTDMVKHYPVAQPDGNVFQWTRNGIASGFQQTQLLDSFVNMVMILTILSRTGVNIESSNFFIKVQGDDSLITLPERLFELHGSKYLDYFAELAMIYFNAKLSVKKSSIHGDLNHVHVLGYKNLCGLPYREDADLLSHLYFPEYPQGLEELAASAVGIAMASLGCSKVVYNVCRDVHSFLVNDLGVQPRLNALRWMERSHMIEDLQQMELQRFPSFREVASMPYQFPTRTHNARERLWPTLPNSANGFFFIDTQY